MGSPVVADAGAEVAASSISASASDSGSVSVRAEAKGAVLVLAFLGIVLYAGTAAIEQRFTRWAFRGQNR